MTTITPRHNFAKLFGLMWLAPLFAFIVILINNPSNADNLLIWFLVMVSVMTAYGLIKGQNWVRYLIALGIIGFSSFGLWKFYQNIQAFEAVYVELYIIMMIALSCFSFGAITFLFNAGMTIEFNRPIKQPINYAEAFSKHQTDKWYLFKHHINLPFSLGLIFIASSVIYWLSLYGLILIHPYPVSQIDFLSSIIFLFPLIIGIMLFFKFKITRYIFPVLMIIIVVLSFIDIFSSNLNTEEIISIIGFHLIFVWIFTLLTLMLFHPLMTFYFEQTVHLVNDYEEILDTE